MSDDNTIESATSDIKSLLADYDSRVPLWTIPLHDREAAEVLRMRANDELEYLLAEKCGGREACHLVQRARREAAEAMRARCVAVVEEMLKDGQKRRRQGSRVRQEAVEAIGRTVGAIQEEAGMHQVECAGAILVALSALPLEPEGEEKP